MIYEYECESGHRFEVQQSIHDEALTKCQCGANCGRIISGGLGTLFPGQTIGAVAEQNLSKMGHYERESKFQSQNEAIQKKKESAPFWRPNTTGPIKMPSNPERYIMEGK